MNFEPDPQQAQVQPAFRREMQPVKAGQALACHRGQGADLRLVAHQDVPVELSLARAGLSAGRPPVSHARRKRAHPPSREAPARTAASKPRRRRRIDMAVASRMNQRRCSRLPICEPPTGPDGCG